MGNDDKADWVSFWMALLGVAMLAVAITHFEGKTDRMPMWVRGVFCVALVPIGMWVGWEGLQSGDWRRTSFVHNAQGVLRMLFGAGLAAFGVVLPLGW